MSEQSVMTTPIFDELVNELGGQPQQENTPPQGDDQQGEDR